MQTRNKGHYTLGFYENLNKPKVYNYFEPIKVKKNIKKNFKTDSTNSNIFEFLNDLNIQILKKLKSFSNQSKICTFELSINSEVYNLLIRKYCLNGKYKVCKKFTEDFQIIKERFFSKTEYCTFPFLEMKLNRERKYKFFDKNMHENELKSKPKLCIRFLRQEKLIN